MSSNSEGSVVSIIGAWKSKADTRLRNKTELAQKRGLVEVCKGKGGECSLYYDTERASYSPQQDCQRGRMCTEFRILKHIANRRASLNSKDPLVQDFYAFKTL